jgi:nitroimidazol reductase NimA-like FMN-containing flavoprotein (pyridoxamine 5'-phosphate oxidase superfamily)
MDIDPRNGMQILDDQECWQLLASQQFGRLAVAPGGRPDIFPVNHLVDNGRLLFRTAEGSKLVALVVNSSVAYEVDGFNAESNEAWSVVLYGRARVVASDDESAALEDLPLFPWNLAPKYNFVEIVVDKFSGRRFVAEGRQQ